MQEGDITRLYIRLRDEKNKDWQRVLPFGELVTDRFEKAEYLDFGDKSSIYDSSIVMGEVSVAAHTWIGPNTLLDGSGGKIVIGSYCDISAGVQIYTHDSVKRCLTGGRQEVERGNVIIGDNCYIAPMCIISRGVTIGNCCVIAAHSFVNRSCGDHVILAGIPARQIGRVVIEGGEARLEYDIPN